MRVANVAGRAAIVLGDEVADVCTASEGHFGRDLMDLYERWDEFAAFASTVSTGTGPLVESELGSPVPHPRQVFGVGLNYRGHAEEAGVELPARPAVFTKFPASLSGPFDDVEIVGDTNDWEGELVVVIGRAAHRVEPADAWSHVAGLTVGQDITDRDLQFAAGFQFSMGKSRATYGPLGPWVVTTDELDDPNDLGVGCSIDGETMQQARTSELIFDVPTLVADMSSVLPLWPGDIIFTGSPAGVGFVRQPPRYLQPGEVLETWVEGIGTIRNRIVRSWA